MRSREIAGPSASALLAIGCGLRLFRFWRPSLWFDEAKTLIVLRSPAGSFLSSIRDLEGVPPLYFLATRFWRLFFSDDLTAVRLLSVVLGCACLWLFALLARRMLPRDWRWALALAALSPFWIHLSQEGRAYALYLLEVVGLGLAWSALERRWSAAAAAGYVTAASAGLYTHICFGFALIAPFVAGFYSGEIKKRRTAWTALHALILAAFVPWLPSLRAQMALSHTALLKQPLNLGNVGALFAAQAVDLPFLDLALARTLELFGLGTALVLAVGALAARRRGEPDERRFAAFAGLNIILPLLCVRLVELLSGRSLAQPRYLLFISPYVYIVTAWLLGRLGRRAAAFGVVAFFALSTVGYCVCRAVVDPRLDRLSAAVRRSSPPSETIVHLDPYFYPALRYHYLPERRHSLVCADEGILPWSRLPGYPAGISRADLAALPSVVVIDARRSLSGSVLSRASGAAIAEYRCP